MMRYPLVHRPVYLALCVCLVSGCAGQPRQEAASRPAAELRACAEAAYQERDLPRAEDCLDRLLASGSAKAGDWYRLGNIYAWTRRPVQAVDAYAEALDRDPDLAEAWFNLGMIQLQQAVYSFSAVRDRLREDDPLYKQADIIVSGILKMIMTTSRQQQQ